MDMLIKKYKDIHKGKKRLCLITNAVHPIKDSLEGTKEDQVETIAAQMTAQGMKMESVVVRGRLSQDANKRIMDENDRLLSIFSKQTLTRTVYVDSPTSLLGALKTRRITPVTVFRGDLELSPDMKIKVRPLACCRSCQAYTLELINYSFFCLISFCFSLSPWPLCFFVLNVNVREKVVLSSV